jgi:hypothetical protein
VRHDRAGDHHTVAVVGLDPLVVLDPDRVGVLGTHPDLGPPRDSDSMNRLSWYSEWMDHLECGVR